jgi:hypothetical protein
MDNTDALSILLGNLVTALITAANATAQAALANIHTAEWTAAMALVGGVWLMISRRGNTTLGLLIFVVAAAASAWLSWKTQHHGMLVQQTVLAVISLHSLRRMAQHGKGAKA